MWFPYSKNKRLQKKSIATMVQALPSLLQNRPLVLVGMMGAGKTTIGKKISQLTHLPFFDCDQEIEAISNRTVEEIFQDYGENEFRRLESCVLERLLASGPAILATGGGAYINPKNRRAIQEKALDIWLKADLDTLMKRVLRKKKRPLLQNHNPHLVMKTLLEEREPFYAHAQITVYNKNEKKLKIARKIILQSYNFLCEQVGACQGNLCYENNAL